MTDELAPDVSSLYSAPIVLWVEDELSRDYLSQLWQDDPLIKFCIAGGKENIRGVVHDARSQGFRHVCGLLDRDFGVSNRDRWSRNEHGIFIPDVHEIENYLLDPDALAGCELNTEPRSAEEIGDRLRQRADELRAWMACRKTIIEMREVTLRDFLPHPTCEEIPDIEQAKSYIEDSAWYSSLDERTQELVRPNYLSDRLKADHDSYGSCLEGDAWIKEFSGKELLHHIRDWIYTRGSGRGIQRDSDVAKAVGRWQVENGFIPQVLSELLAALRSRVAS
ncbi:MAG: DUF4435 domain-containing protein [Deltaproteobacteria bacterium]|nr:DUF4435 domain-containing protein [Deltaproteobacteria bacterium]